ncbi:MAG: reverse transcriptase family protein [Kangiellaceae bacterium]|nr:reverse transcriptase family protein [Kangiellaceae bacterium]
MINKNKTIKTKDKILVNDEIISDKYLIASHFKDYFVNMGAELVDKIPPSEVNPLTFIHTNTPNSIIIEPATINEITNIVTSSENSSPGWDGISMKVFKRCLPAVMDPMLFVINLSLQQGVFPTELKLAKVIPVFKKGQEILICNYRPISVLPAISKILEKLMYSRLMSFIKRSNLLYSYQFGFRKNHGANMALITTVDRILQAHERGEIVIGLFLDFQKAFDTVDHEILLNKLSIYGMRGVAHKWLTSYLNQRNQQVLFFSGSSSNQTISHGVPQGSILGPLLFLLYVNDMANVSNLLFFILFADDTNVFISGRDLDSLIDVINAELTNLATWLKANKLSINYTKTQYIIFKTKNKRCQSTKAIMLDEHEILRVTSTRFLGVILNETLNWSEHINNIRNKISKGIGILCKACKVFDTTTCITLYNAFIYPYLSYCIEIWGATYPSQLATLITIQKKALRICTNSNYRAHTDPLFSQHSILKLNQIYQLQTLMILYKHHSNRLPSPFQDFFTKNDSLHNVATRQSTWYSLPRLRLTCSFHSIRYNGPKIWNSALRNKILILPDDASISRIKKNLIRKFLSNIES